MAFLGVCWQSPPLVGGRAEDGGDLGPEIRVSSSFFHDKWLPQSYQRQAWVQVDFIPFKCVHSPWHCYLCHTGEQCENKRD